jgi:hypothetical protein
MNRIVSGREGVFIGVDLVCVVMDVQWPELSFRRTNAEGSVTIEIVVMERAINVASG